MSYPIKVLHVLGGVRTGGAETWFVQLLDHMDPRRIHLDLLVQNPHGDYAERIREKGSKILHSNHHNQPYKYANTVSRIIRENGPYRAIHSHLQLYSGWVLRIAHKCEIPIRIAHARNSMDGKKNNIPRSAYCALMKYYIRRHATHLLAVSDKAAMGAFGSKMIRRIGFDVMTGMDFSSFKVEINRGILREELGIPPNAMVIGHIGSFRQQKNHEFLLKIIREVVDRRRNVIALLLGTGELRNQVEENAKSLELTRNVRFLGDRSDAIKILKAMDVFVFPSFYEGLPRVLVEAQAVGLPCVVSNTITREVVAGPGIPIEFVGLEENPQTWANIVFKSSKLPVSEKRGEIAVRYFNERGFNIETNVQKLIKIYDSFNV